MAEKIRAHGGVAEERTYRGVGHLTLIGAFAPALRVLAPVLREATQFAGASHGRPICQHLSNTDTEQDTRRARPSWHPEISWQPLLTKTRARPQGNRLGKVVKGFSSRLQIDSVFICIGRCEAVRGPRGGVAVRVPHGGAAVVGPHGGAAVRGPHGGYRVGQRYYGG